MNVDKTIEQFARMAKLLDEIENLIDEAVEGYDKIDAMIMINAALATVLDVQCIKRGVNAAKNRKKMVEIGEAVDKELRRDEGNECN